jgi:glutathione synthase/RimK-type ligase-like ATP-grasp enzyme
MHILIIGNPENRRVDLFSQAAIRLGLPAPEVVSYLDLLNGKILLQEKIRPDTLLRIESPGENFEVEKRLIALGAHSASGSLSKCISAEEAQNLAYDHGRIRFLQQWYAGFTTVLQAWQEVLSTHRPLFLMNTPQAIALMFDKINCQKTIAARGVPIPEIQTGIMDYNTLRTALQATDGKRVFIKPAHASSASGVMAYRMNANREEAITSIEWINQNGQIKFYNSLQVRRYTARQKIADMVNFILQENAIVEEWIPKASYNGFIFDVRVVVVDGKAKHVLPRLSTSPLTNLHLGNQRGNARELQDKLGQSKYQQLLTTAEQAVKAIPGAFYAGVDLVIPAGFGIPKVLEVNAFGDLLPNLLHQGEDTYTAELNTLLAKTAK